MAQSMAIKGVGDALLIHVPEGQSAGLPGDLLDMIDERAEFFDGARLALDLGARNVGAGDLGQIRDALSERGVTLWAVISTSDITQSAARDLGLARELRGSAQVEAEILPLDTELEGDEAVLLERTMRSGNSVQHPGHVIVLGDVNPGAEIIAGGHVIVWGHLRGVVHAGAAGDESAVVCALDLSPTQLRIAGHIALSPERRSPPQPEVAKVREGQIVAEPWASGR